MPIGIVAGKAEYLDAFDGGNWRYGDDSWPETGVTFFAGTFIRHPLALAAGKAMLEHLKAAGPELQETLNAKTSRFVGGLNVHFEQVGVPIRLTHFGSIFYFQFAPDLKWASLLFYYLRANGVHIWEGRPCFLSTAHTDADLKFLTSAFQKSVAEMQEGGFLPGPPQPISFPLTEPQKEVWLAAQMGESASNALIESLSVHLSGEFQIEAMQQAVQSVADRHGALRATFSPNGDCQQIAPFLTIPVRVQDFSALAEDEREAALSARLAEEGQTPFDLEAGPLLRAEIVRLEETRHVLILSAHHLVCDGWSFGLILSEIGALYTAAVNGVESALPTPMPFHRFAEEQSSEAAKNASHAAEAYWKTQLAGPLPRLELPTDRTRPGTPLFHGGRQQRCLGGELSAGLKRWSAEEGCTLFTTLFSGFAALLQRLTSQDDFIVGIPAAGQSQMENSCLVGHCVHLLPVRVNGEADQPFREFLTAAKSLIFEAYDHQDCTWGQLLQTLPSARDAGNSPPLGVTFNVDRLPPNLHFGDLEWTLETNPRRFYQFDLGFNIIESKDALTVECDYSSDLFDDSTIVRWLGHFETLLAGAVKNPSCPLSEMPLLNAAEQNQILNQGSRNFGEALPKECVQTLFEKQAIETPNAIALEFGNTQLTYQELNGRANQWAHRLRELGVGPDTRVAVLVERSLEMVIALLACLKSGGAYAPLDPAYPSARLQFLLDDARPKVMLTQRSLGTDQVNFDGPIVDVNTDDFTAYPTANLSSDTAQDNLACLIYTSGSTGAPKGVAVPHRGIVRLVKNTDYLDFSPSQVFLQMASLSFDASTFEIWGPLLNGGRLIIMPPEPPSLSKIGEAIQKHGVTTLWLTAGLFHALVDHDIKALQPLQQLIAGGDALSAAHCRRIVSELPHLRLVNGYGPTECTTFAVCHTIQAADLQGNNVPIGKPISHTSAYVLDERQRLVPTGVEGELWLGGPGLAREYWNQPQLTAQRFVTHQFEDDSYGPERLYATGDRVRRRPNGILEFHGRRDQQIKIRGFRVEVGEIEQALLAHPAVGQAVVVAHEYGPADKRLTAYVVPHTVSAPTEEELRQFLADKLPPFLIPSALVFLPQIPLNANGKPDRKALPPPEPPRRTVETVTETPNGLEQSLLPIWQEVLGIASLGRHDNFFDSGGHSLLALQLFGRIEKQLGVSLPFPTIFQAPTVAQLAKRLRCKECAEAQEALLVPIQPLGSKPRLFCIHPDHGLVLFYNELAKNLADDQPVYGIQAAGLLENQLPDVTIEQMADRYLREIQVLQPVGPYYLAGYSLGGVIAFEMAHRLQSQGQTVAFLGMLDTYAPVAFQKNLIEKSPLQRTAGHLSVLNALSPPKKWEYLKQKANEAVYGKKSDWEKVSGELKESVRPEKIEMLQKTVIANGQANFAYSPKPYFGKTTLFRAAELDVFEFYDPHLWWTDFCVGGLEIQEVPGSHWTMMKMPEVQTLAQKLQACLDKATLCP